MHLKEINPEKTPELFYMSDSNGDFTLTAIDTSDIHSDGCLKSLMKKVYGGTAQFKMYQDHIEIKYNEILIAKADLVAEYFTTSWQSVTFDFSTANITKIGDDTFRFVMIQGNNVFGLEWTFGYGAQTKQTFYLDIPGRDVKIKWRTEVWDNALAKYRDDGRGLKYSVADYTGEVTKKTPNHPTKGWSYHVWTFEPEGYTCDALDTRTAMERYNQNAGLVVDPYLDIDEQTLYIDITCDGFTFRAREPDVSTGVGFLRSLDGSTSLCQIAPQVYSGDPYYIGFDAEYYWTILEQTSTRFHLRLIGSFYTDDIGSLSGDDYSIFDFYIYPDRIAVEWNWHTDGQITLTSASGYQGIVLVDSVLTNDTNAYESSGAESYFVSQGQQSTANYMATLADEISIQKINTFNSKESGTATFSQATYYANTLCFSWYNGTIGTAATDEIHMLSEIWIVDSIERETIQLKTVWTDASFSVTDLVINDSIGYECISAVTSGNSGVTEPGTGSGWTTYWVQCHKYTVAERLEQGEQYKDAILTLTRGTAITTGINLIAIESSGFASDGAWHFEP